MTAPAPAPRAILFDFDGTLADTARGIVATVQGTLERLGYPAADPAAVRRTIGLPLTDCFRLATAVPDAQVDDAVAIYRQLFPSLALDHIVIYPHVLDTLDLLRRRGHILAIVSSRHHMSLDPLVQQLGIIRHIPLDHVFGEGDGTALRPKPAPDLALHALAALGLPASDALVVGDTTFDILMGSSAGCRTCAVTYGNQQRPQLLTAHPGAIIDRFDQLPATL